MENFTPISRELTNSRFWHSLSDKESRILTDLLTHAPYKATTYNLYGVDIKLGKYELCFSSVKMAKKYGVSEHVIKRYLSKLADYGLLEKKRRKLEPELCSDKRTNNCNTGNLRFVTSITFYGWVFGESQIERPLAENDGTTALSNTLQNTEDFKTEDINIKSACEKNFSSNQSGVKNWIPLKKIKALDFPYADEIVKEWSQFCSKKRELVLEELTKYCDSQIRLQQTEMTLPVFDYRFRIVLKKAFNVKEYKTLEDTPFLNYLN
ncbi:MAG: hypothetical protein ACRCX5_02600 [Bacteroidales bacterium]